MKKRLLSVLLTLMMIATLVSVMSIQASAEGEGASTTHTNHCVCGTSHEAVGDHTSEEMITWSPWDGTGEITYNSEGVAYLYLTQDVVASKKNSNDWYWQQVSANQELYLCLQQSNEEH